MSASHSDQTSMVWFRPISGSSVSDNIIFSLSFNFMAASLGVEHYILLSFNFMAASLGVEPSQTHLTLTGVTMTFLGGLAVCLLFPKMFHQTFVSLMDGFCGFDAIALGIKRKANAPKSISIVPPWVMAVPIIFGQLTTHVCDAFCHFFLSRRFCALLPFSLVTKARVFQHTLRCGVSIYSSTSVPSSASTVIFVRHLAVKHALA